MATEIKVPTLGESVTEATVARWLKKVGDSINVDDALVELETDKVTLEVNAQAAGTLAEIVAAEGANVAVGALLGVIGEGAGAPAAKPAAASPAPAVAAPAPAAAPAAPVAGAPVFPAAAKIAADNGVDTGAIAGTGKDGRVTKGDVLAAIETPKAAAPAPAPKPAPAPSGPRAKADLEERVRMTRLRQRIAERLKEA